MVELCVTEKGFYMRLRAKAKQSKPEMKFQHARGEKQIDRDVDASLATISLTTRFGW